MQSIKHTINSNLKKYRIEDKVKGVMIVKHWEKVISELFPHASLKTMAVSFEKGVLKIATLSKEIAYEISLYRQRLIDALNNLIGKRLVFALQLEY